MVVCGCLKSREFFAKRKKETRKQARGRFRSILQSKMQGFRASCDFLDSPPFTLRKDSGRRLPYLIISLRVHFVEWKDRIVFFPTAPSLRPTGFLDSYISAHSGFNL